MVASPVKLLNSVFGYRRFRGHQEAIIESVIAGRDTVVLMPTGGGKSLCYQIPSLVLPGAGVVVSPLIALMQNQVSAMRQLGIRATYINSTLDPREARQREKLMHQDQYDLIYVAPERLMTDRFLACLEQTSLALFAIDEAHCVSQWGHDFRPEYIQLSVLKKRFPKTPCIALTATANVPTRQEIVERLGLERAKIFSDSFDRPNIRYSVRLKNNARRQLLGFLRDEHSEDCGIVYCLSRKKVEETAVFLNNNGFPALPYHAGLPASLREANQERFLRESALIMVATVAFGMGIDKPDVRFVAHLDMPKSLEAYYQETGRAGRDGLASNAWMTYGIADVVMLRQLMAGSKADERIKRIEGHKLQAMLGFCETATCRRQVLLNHFGEKSLEPCNNCDTCLDPVSTWDGGIAAQKAMSCVYRTGQRFGVNYLVDVLLGNDTARISQFGHAKVSTFGIGKEYDEMQWKSVYRQLVAAGLLTVDVEGHGGLRLTDSSRAVLTGTLPIRFRKDPIHTAKSKIKPRMAESKPPLGSNDQHNVALWESLRSLRLKLAQEQNMPPYVIFHDSTLKDIVAYRPKNRNELQRISGIGLTKLERYGQALLEVVERHEARGKRSEDIPPIVNQFPDGHHRSDPNSGARD